jgi:myo-inositol 2-dehydrogenase / D-chiro-inositol 1-dehydrogenase
VAEPASTLGVLVAGAIRHAHEYAALIARHPQLHLIGVAEDADAAAWQLTRAKELALAHGVHYQPLANALDNPDLDLVLVTTEPARHAETATQAILAGHSVLVDKPVATRRSDARRLATVARSAPAITGYVHRLFSPALERLREHVASGALGLPRSLELTWISADSVGQEGGAVIVDPTLSGGGEIWNFLGYPLDTVLWLTGLPVRRVSATGTSVTSEEHSHFGVESLATVTVELDGGVHASIAVGRGPSASHGIYTTAIVGSHGYAAVDELHPELEVVFADGSESDGLADERLFELTFERVLDDMAAAVRGRGTLRRTLAEGCELAEVIAAATEAAATGQPTTIV